MGALIVVQSIAARKAQKSTGTQAAYSMMVVSMLEVIIVLPETTSIKDKRHVVMMAKERLRNKFHLSVAEIDLQDSLGFAQLGAAHVSNSREFGEKVMHRALDFLEDSLDLKIQDAQIHSEEYS